MRALLLAAVLALAACGAPKGSHPRAPANASADDDPDTEEQLVCKDERTTGTNMSRVVCRTPDQIEQERAAAKVWETNRRTEFSTNKP
jgi:predicted small lipoprotein YifL